MRVKLNKNKSAESPRKPVVPIEPRWVTETSIPRRNSRFVMHRGGNHARNHSSSRPHDSASQKTKHTLVYDRDSAVHTCKQLRVQLSAIYTIAEYRQTDEHYLIICDRSEKLERPTVKSALRDRTHSGRRKYSRCKGRIHCGWRAPNAAVFGRKFAKSFPSFRKVRIVKLRTISTETTTVSREEGGL